MRWVVRIVLVSVLVGQVIGAWWDSTFDWRIHLAQEAYSAGRYQDALDGFTSAREIEDADSSVWAWIGDSADALYRNPPAGGWTSVGAQKVLSVAWSGYAGAVLRAPYDTWSWTGLAETALRRGARRDLDRGVDLEELGRRSKGVLDAWRGAAMVAAKIAVALKPSGYQELDVLAEAYSATGQLDRAKETAIRSARMMPAPSAHTWGNGDQLVGPLYKAILDASKDGLARSPKFERSGLHRDIGRFAMRQGDLDTAVSELRAAVATARDVGERYLARRGLAQALESKGQLDEAVVVWSAVVDSGVAAPADRRQRGIDLARAHRDSEACIDLRQAVRDEPSDDAQRIYASKICERAGDLETAGRLLRDGFREPTENLTIARALIDFYVRTGRLGTARGLLLSWTRDFPNRKDFGEWERDLVGSSP